MLTRQITHAATIFDALGGANTGSNPSSTRNARATLLEFDQIDGSLVGASFRHFMLESTRVISRIASEPNFNIFYQLLASPSSVKAQVLGPDWAGATAQDFAYLTSSEISETEFAGGWKRISLALLQFGWEGTSLQYLMQAVAIVLLLGNVTFIVQDDSASVQSRADLNMLAISLGLPVEDLEEAMTERQIVTADGMHKASQPHAGAAEEVCDALAKAIYECLFASVSRQINILTAAPPLSSGKPRLIHVVDMFGFVNQEKNGLDQLLVNFANERMQLKYVVECFRAKRKVFCESERNRKLPLLDALDNSETIALFEGSNGIFQCVIDTSRNDDGVEMVSPGHLVDGR
jgi:myosin heavy subunit